MTEQQENVAIKSNDEKMEASKGEELRRIIGVDQDVELSTEGLLLMAVYKIGVLEHHVEQIMNAIQWAGTEEGSEKSNGSGIIM